MVETFPQTHYCKEGKSRSRHIYISKDSPFGHRNAIVTVRKVTAPKTFGAEAYALGWIES